MDQIHYTLRADIHRVLYEHKAEEQQEERHLLFCSTCHTKLADKNPRWNQIINAQSQNIKALRQKTYEIEVPIRS